jgi:two-component system, OmpR family, phosphate regulon sensor histidine kinase PhoR
LAEAEETLRAIRSGEVDALVVKTSQGDRLFTLQGADTIYRVAMDNVNEGIVTLSIEGNILYSNSCFAQMLGTDLNKVISASIFDFVSPENHEMLSTLLRQDHNRAELQLLTAAGTKVPVYLSTRKLNLDNLVSNCAIFTDLTQQKHNEELINTGMLIQGILKQSTNAVIVCDAEGKIIYASEVANRLCGGYIVGQPIDKALACVQVAGKPLQFTDICGGNVIDNGVFNNKSNGSIEYLLVRCGSLQTGKIKKGYVVSLTDITALKTEEKLKDEFIGMVSHEIRTPLTVLIGAIGVAMDKGVSPEEVQELLHDAMKGAEDLNDILNNLIELSRYQSDRLQLQKEPINMGEFINNLIAKQKMRDIKRQIIVNISDKLPMVHADSRRLDMILRNLLDNAVKYSADDTEIRVSVEKQPDELVIAVSDRGTGIPLEQQANLFRPFERLGDTTYAKGLGLGLLVCKRLIEAHNGRIWVESKPGVGSTFYFTLPTGQAGS